VADRYFVGDTDSDWNDASNWAASSGGAGGAGVPGSSDKAILDGNSPDCTCDVAPNVSGVDLQAAFANTLDMNGFALTVGSGGFSQAGGTFSGSTETLDFNGAFTLSGGAFTSTSGELKLAGNATFSGGTFTHNSGTVRNDADATFTFTVSPVFNDAIIQHAGNLTVNSGVWDIDGDLTIGGINVLQGTGSITVAGDLTSNDASGVIGVLKIELDGTGTQNVGGTGGYLPKIKINKASGDVEINADIHVFGGWEWVAGTINWNSHQVAFRSGSQTIDAGSEHFYDVQFNTAGNLTFVGTVYIDNDLLISAANALQTGTLRVRGDIDTRDDSLSVATATIIIDGTGDQVLSSSDGTGVVCNLQIDKSSGTLTILDTIRMQGTSFTYTAGTVDASGSKIVFYTSINAITPGAMKFGDVQFHTSAGTVTITGTLDIDGNLSITRVATLNGGGIKLAGRLTTSDSTVTGTATIELDGSGDQEIDCSGGCHISRISPLAQTLSSFQA
jgi:hypothetical protein